MTAGLLFTDVEGALRAWLRTHPLVQPVVGGRVFFGIPDSTAYPLLTVARIGGGPTEGVVPLDIARVSFDAWADTKAVAADLAARLVSALQAMESEPLDGSVMGQGAIVDSVLWRPDPTTGRPRYVVDASVTVSALNPTP